MKNDIRVGISGWNYEPWKKTFYPEGLPARKHLYFASRQVNSIEINGSFYSLQNPSSYQKWYDETPKDFVFSVKGGRYISHIRRLKDIEIPLANFFASGVLLLKEKLGPILWQFPPRMNYNPDRFEEFFSLLPKTTEDVAKLAKKNDGRLDEAYVKSPFHKKMRYCVEVRNPSFENPIFLDQLRRHNIALVFADTAGKWPYIEDFTSDFVYVRLHGDTELYVSGYSEEAIRWWARRLKTWLAGKLPNPDYSISEPCPPPAIDSVFVYFDNDVKVRAPFDALSLLTKLTDFKPEQNIEYKPLAKNFKLPSVNKKLWSYPRKAK